MSPAIRGIVIFLAGILAVVLGSIVGGGTSIFEHIVVSCGLALILAGILEAKGTMSAKKILGIVLVVALILAVVDLASYHFAKQYFRDLDG
jgi:hypothetical protein